jgi:hypothetical protein
MRRRIIALAVCLAVVASGAADAASLPGVLTQIGRGPTFAVRPAQIIYTGDGSGVLGGYSGSGPNPHFGRLSWTLWNRHQAVGHGAVWLDDCEPNCAEGTFHPYPVRVHAFGVQRGHFTHLTLRYDFEGKEVIDRRMVLKHGSFYTY